MVAFDRCPAYLLLEPDADGLLALAGGAGVPKRVVLEDEVSCLPPDPNADGSFLEAVVFDEIVLHAVAMRRHPFGFVAEAHPVAMIAPHLVVAEQVVGVFVLDGDAEPAVVFEDVPIEKPLFDPPAEEKAVLAVVPRHTLAEDGTLGTAAGVEAQARVALAQAAGQRHVVALLETDAVAVVIAHGAPLQDRSMTTVEKDAAAPGAGSVAAAPEPAAAQLRATRGKNRVVFIWSTSFSKARRRPPRR